MSAEWWVCRRCDPEVGHRIRRVGPCIILRAKEPTNCVDHQWNQGQYNDWRPATPEDMAEIKKSLESDLPPVRFRGEDAGCRRCDLYAKAKRLHVCIRGQSMEYKKCGYKGPTND